MKQLLLIVFMCCIVLSLFASKSIIIDSTVTTNKPTYIAIPSNATMKQLLGRKLTLKEKLGLLLAKTNYKKGIPMDALETKRANNAAVLGFVFAILGFGFFPFIIPGYILSNNALKKEKSQPGLLTDTNKTLAQIGKAFVIVYGILIVLTLMLLIILIARFGMY